jgi:hypothetical protein
LNAASHCPPKDRLGVNRIVRSLRLPDVIARPAV